MLEETQTVALFIDFNSVRRGYTRTYGCEPEPLELMEKARAYGRVVTATAYADFTAHPSRLRRTLEVAGIVPCDIPKRNSGSRKSPASMVMLMDVVDCLLDRPNVGVYVLMTDSSDFIRIVTRARHRFAKTVIIVGVPGLVNQDLIESADGMAPLISQRVAVPATATENVISPTNLPEGVSRTEARLVELIDYLERNRPYLTFSFIHSYAVNPVGRLRLRDVEATELLDRFVEEGLLIPFEKRLADGRIVVNVRLNYGHPLSQQLVRQPT